MSRATGCRKLHMAIRTKGVGGAITYAQPVAIPHLESIQYNAEYNSATGYSDDTVDTNIRQIKKVGVTVTLAMLSAELKAKIEGHKFDKGKVTISKNDVAPEVALLWEETKADGSYTDRILWRGVLSVDGMTDKTNGENIDFNKVQLTGDFVPDENGFVMDELDSDAVGVDATALSKFFSQPPTAPTIAPGDGGH